mmetsp:Transcript_15024/g.21464  ORF Transcript_15024/g.21464 Transcript_15024/m.21464 type:complete len:370 (+) Transcript_15024:93-1202(+)
MCRYNRKPFKLAAYLFAFLFTFSGTPFVCASGDNSGSGSGDGDDDFFNFDDATQWSDYAMIAKRCITFKDEDYIVFEMFGKGHNVCKKKSLGYYKSTIPDFVKAYTKQMEDNADIEGQGFDLSEDAMNLLQCSQYYVNDALLYVKVGCRSNTGRGLQVMTYSDEYCTVKSNTNYNVNVDISTLRINFDTCKDCVVWPNNQGNDDQAQAYDDGFYYDHEYESPLCSGAWFYKSECNGKCRKLTNSSSESKSKHFSVFGKFLLFVFSVLGLFLLLAVLAQRKKMSTKDALLEEAVVKKVGIEMKYIPRIVLGIILLVCLLMLLEIKVLTWLSLIIINMFLFGYWCYLKYRAEGKVTVGGIQLYSNDQREVS